MKKTASITIMEVKNTKCEIGEVFKAFDKWLRLALRKSHYENKLAGFSLQQHAITVAERSAKAAITAAVNRTVIILGGLLGSDLNV